MDRKLKIGLYSSGIILFAALIAYVSIIYGHTLTGTVTSQEEIGQLLSSFGMKSFLVFILLQASQIVFIPLPGEFVQLAGGYMYGTWMGTVYAVLGSLIGTILSFGIARLLGYPLLKTIFGEAKMARIEALVRKPQSKIILFLLFLMPGLPKDTMTYMAGVTPIDPFEFCLTATTARVPGIMLSAYIGSNLYHKDYTAVIAASLFTILLLGFGFLARKRLAKDSI